MDNLKDIEILVEQLKDPKLLEEYKNPFDNYSVNILPKIFGTFLVVCGNLVYGKKPSYLKFRAVEVIARVPYQSWSSASYTLLTLFYGNEERAMTLARTTKYARFAHDNETMHVVVISNISSKEKRSGIIKYTIIPMLFAFFYFWVSYFLYLIRPKWSLELNYLFESHAFSQYDEFIKTHEHNLKNKFIDSEFLRMYGRNPINQYDFFLSVRNDEIIHRNQSIREIDRC